MNCGDGPTVTWYTTSAAFSARSRNRSSDARSACCAVRCSVMSKNVQITAVTDPSSAKTGDVPAMTHAVPRPLERRPITKLVSTSPVRSVRTEGSSAVGNTSPCSSTKSKL